jgi:hypothetical protein
VRSAVRRAISLALTCFLTAPLFACALPRVATYRGGGGPRRRKQDTQAPLAAAAAAATDGRATTDTPPACHACLVVCARMRDTHPPYTRYTLLPSSWCCHDVIAAMTTASAALRQPGPAWREVDVGRHNCVRACAGGRGLRHGRGRAGLRPALLRVVSRCPPAAPYIFPGDNTPRSRSRVTERCCSAARPANGTPVPPRGGLSWWQRRTGPHGRAARTLSCAFVTRLPAPKHRYGDARRRLRLQAAGWPHWRPERLAIINAI